MRWNAFQVNWASAWEHQARLRYTLHYIEYVTWHFVGQFYALPVRRACVHRLCFGPVDDKMSHSFIHSSALLIVLLFMLWHIFQFNSLFHYDRKILCSLNIVVRWMLLLLYTHIYIFINCLVCSLNSGFFFLVFTSAFVSHFSTHCVCVCSFVFFGLVFIIFNDHNLFLCNSNKCFQSMLWLHLT